MKIPFTFQMSGQLVFQNDAFHWLPELLKKKSLQRPFVITDPGIVKAGLWNRASVLLTDSGFEPGFFAGVETDPGMEVVHEAFDLARTFNPDCVIGLGGGSSLDIAKVVANLLKNNQPLHTMLGIDQVKAPGLPTFMIPTTAGTGSEVTPIAVLSDKKENLKKGIVSDYFYPAVAIVDPTLCATVPAHITAYTGIDALTHAIEAYTNKYAHPFVDTFALKAVELISANLLAAIADGHNMEARYNMSLGSLYGGLCLGAVNTAAVHALAYPLGGMFDVPHGVANSLLLPYVIEFNMRESAGKYGHVARAMGIPTDHLQPEEAGRACVDAIKNLCDRAGIIKRMHELNIPESAIPEMAQGAMKVTRLLNNNPREVTYDDAFSIYQQAY